MPLTTALPMKQMLCRSKGVSAVPAWAVGTFSSGIASPVSVSAAKFHSTRTRLAATKPPEADKPFLHRMRLGLLGELGARGPICDAGGGAEPSSTPITDRMAIRTISP